MKITEKKMVLRELVSERICNGCGESLGYYDVGGVLTEDEDADWVEHLGLVDVKYSGSYWSVPEIGDGVNYQFDLCEQCLFKLIASFKIPAHQWDHDSDQSYHMIQETLNKIASETDPGKLAEYMVDEDSRIRSYSKAKYQKLLEES